MDKHMIPIWETIERNLYAEDSDSVIGTENVHFLNLSKGCKRLFVNVQISRSDNDPFTELERWHISLGSQYCEMFSGTIEEAKKQALTHLPKAIEEAKIIIERYNSLSSCTGQT